MRLRRKKISMIGMLFCMLFLFGITGEAAGQKIKLNKMSVSIRKGESDQLKLKGASGKVKWKSGNKSIAAVTASGKVIGKKKGTCEVTATYRKKSYSCQVTVAKSMTEQIRAKNPVKKNREKILLAGSSSIARWSSAVSAFAPYSIVNVAKSGSTMKQWTQWYKEAIIPYKPTTIVWYVGGNDLWKRTSPDKTAKMFINTAKKLHKALPNTQIYYVSIYTNISRKSISKQILAYNKKLKEFCAKTRYMTYIDLGTKFNNSGTALSGLLTDGLHPNEEGYKIWRDVVASKIKMDMKRRGFKPDMNLSDTTNTENITNQKPGNTSEDSLIITGNETYIDEVFGELNQSTIW